MIEDVRTVIYWICIALGLFLGFHFGESVGKSEMGMTCIEVIGNTAVQKSEVRKNNSEANKNDIRTLENLPIDPSPTPTPEKEDMRS